MKIAQAAAAAAVLSSIDSSGIEEYSLDRREKEEEEEEREEGEGERMNHPWNGVDTQESSSSAQQCDTSLSLS